MVRMGAEAAATGDALARELPVVFMKIKPPFVQLVSSPF
jgi:hypothetical protein